MNHPDELHGKSSRMRYFTPELFLQLNSSDSQTVSDAMDRWEKAIIAYKSRLRRVRQEMPPQEVPLTELSLHDWNLVEINRDAAPVAAAAPSAFIVLQQNKNFIILSYALSNTLQLLASPKEWPLSKKRVHWLYDELDFDGTDPQSRVHRILFSDGTTLLVPFSSCRVVPMKSDRAMSHSDLMQIA